MKKLIVSAFLIMVAFPCISQNSDCKYDKNEVDKFTHKKILWTKWEKLTTLFGNLKEYVPQVRFVKEDTLKQLILFVDGYYYTNFKPTKEDIDSAKIIPAGSKLIILLEDQKSYELATAKPLNSSGDYVSPYTGDNKSEKYQVHWHIGIQYPLDEFAIKMLLAQGATAMRVYFGKDTYSDYNIHKKKYNTFQQLISCINAQD